MRCAVLVGAPMKNNFFSRNVLALGLCLVAFSVIVTSCESTRDLNEEGELVGVPARWQNRAESPEPLDLTSLTTWWRGFNDSLLTQLISDALLNSTDLRTALSRINEARALVGVERSYLFPSVNAGLGARGSRIDTRGLPVVSSESYNTSLTPSWEVDLFGRQGQNLKATRANLRETVENYYAAQVTLTADLALAYVALRRAEAQLVVAENSIKTRGETVQISQWKEEAGTGTALDAIQSGVTLDQARAAIPGLKQTIAQTHNQIALLSGKTPGALDALLARPRPIPSLPSRLAIGIPAETLRQRPDVRAAEDAIEAAAARKKVAQLERLPSLNLSGSIGLEALKAGRLFSPETLAANAVGNLTAPIFEAGRIKENIIIQDERLKQAVIGYESTVLTALSEVEDALIAIRRQAEKYAILRRTAKSALEASTLARQQYQAGQVDLLSVLEAERTLLNLEDQTIATQAAEIDAHIQLYKALGGGWSTH